MIHTTELNVKELAQHYGVHEMSVRRWIVSGLPVNPPKETTIDISVADKWILDNNRLTGKYQGERPKADTAA